MRLLNKILGNAGEVSSEKLQQDYVQLLMSNEQVELGFQMKTFQA